MIFFAIEDRDAQLADKVYVEETNRKSSSLNVPESHLSYSYTTDAVFSEVHDHKRAEKDKCVANALSLCGS